MTAEPVPFDYEDSFRLRREKAAAGSDPVAQILGPRADLSSWRTTAGLSWIAEGFLPRTGVAMVSAGTGVGKSILLQDLMLRLAAGVGDRWLGAYELSEEPFKVCIIERENGALRFMRRARELVLGNALTASEVDLALGCLDTRHARGIAHPELVVKSLREIHESVGADLYWLDPLRGFLPADVDNENDNVVMGRVVDALVSFTQDARTCCLVVDHDSKAGAVARGASAKLDAVEFALHITRPSPEDEDYFQAERVKSRDPSRAPRLVSFRRVCGEPIADGSGGWLHPVRFEGCDRQEIAKANERQAAALARRLAVLRLVEERWASQQTGTRPNHVVGYFEARGEECNERTARRDLEALLAQVPAVVFRPSDRGPVYPIAARASQ